MSTTTFPQLDYPAAHPITFVYLREDGGGFLALQACTVDNDHVWACKLPDAYEYSKSSNLADDVASIFDGTYVEWNTDVLDEDTARNFGEIVATWDVDVAEPDIESNLGSASQEALQTAGYEVPDFA